MDSELELCYKSTTFCDGNGGRCLKFKTCPLALTDDVRQKADRWWVANGDSIDEDVPLAIFNAPRKLDCYEPPIKVPVPTPSDEADDSNTEKGTLI